MAVFFNNFPTIQYDMDRDGNPIEATDIFKRFGPVKDVLDQISIYYTYHVMEGERPDIVSFKFYKSVDYDWLILMFNRMTDRFFDWPLDYQQMNKFLIKKFGSVEASTQQVHHYERIIQHRQTLDDGTVIPERTLKIDFATYTSLSESNRRVVYQYDWYISENDKRRIIKIPNEIYIPQIDLEKRSILA